MKKRLISFLAVIFILLIATNVYPTENSLKHFKLSKSCFFSIGKFNEEFSLKKSYEAEIKKINVPFFELEKRGREPNLQETGRDPKIDELREKISKLKKKKTFSLIASIGFAGLGAFFLYEFITYEEKERATQVTEEGGRGKLSGHRGFALGGGLASFAVSVMLVFDVVKKNKAIKSYEKELIKMGDKK